MERISTMYISIHGKSEIGTQCPVQFLCAEKYNESTLQVWVLMPEVATSNLIKREWHVFKTFDRFHAHDLTYLGMADCAGDRFFIFERLVNDVESVDRVLGAVMDADLEV